MIRRGKVRTPAAPTAVWRMNLRRVIPVGLESERRPGLIQYFRLRFLPSSTFLLPLYRLRVPVVLAYDTKPQRRTALTLPHDVEVVRVGPCIIAHTLSARHRAASIASSLVATTTTEPT